MRDTLNILPARELPVEPTQLPPATLPEDALTPDGVQTDEASEVAEVQTVLPGKLKKTTVKSRKEIPQYLLYPYQGKAVDYRAELIATADDNATDTIPTDSLSVDSTALAIPGEIKEGIVLVDPASAYRDMAKAGNAESSTDGMSWIYLGLALLFCITAIKFKGSKRYLRALLSDLTDTRVRHNAFDDTVKETSLLVLLNMLWAACAGILLWIFVRMNVGMMMLQGFSIGITSNQAEGIAICMGMAAAYIVLMQLAYLAVGRVFSDAKMTSLWVKGASASTALQSILLLPLSLLALNYPAWQTAVLIISAGVFLIGKIIFLYKGFRIFFNQISSWLLFLYYLCSLEIVPLILTCALTVAACSAAI